MLAKDIMRKRVVCLSPETTLAAAAALFSKRGISGAPVVSAEGRLLGVLSRTDMAGRDGALRAEQAMTPWAVSLEEDTPVRELASQMLAKRIHRIMITRNGEIRGIVTSMDMLRALLKL